MSRLEIKKMKHDVIIRGVGGFYDVQTIDGQVVRCRLRGRLRLADNRVLVGDRVQITITGDLEGVIEDVLPRDNYLIRPPIANIEQAIVVMALANPEPDLQLLDRLLVLIGSQQITPIICFNKTDLCLEEQVLSIKYQQCGFTVVVTSAEKNIGILDLQNLLAGKISTFAGPSGVGKSSLLNKIEPGLELAVSEVSQKLRRGRHTTREVQLIPLSNGGLVADTPGFSQLTLPNMEPVELQEYFPEIWALAGQCRFRGCLHHKEPGCAVTAAVEEQSILESRYQNYLILLEELDKLKVY